MNLESNIKELEQLEDKDIEKKKKIKKDHKIKPDDIFYRVKLTYNNYSQIYRSKKNNIKKGGFLIVPTSYGPEIGIVQGKITNMDEILSEDEILDVVRIATNSDKKKFEANKQKSKDAFSIAVKKIKKHKLEMKLINVHYFLEDNKILFNFTADGRIDFRELVKDLASIFKTRIELRQIGVRDECRIMSGYGHCGMHLCCSNVANELNPITIKMAKEQNITLNSLKISGICGRLLCCLSYEYDAYLDEKKDYPDEGAKIKVNDQWYSVIEVNILSKKVKLISHANESFICIDADLIQYNKNKKEGIVTKKIEF
jgi:cell fate regulator YaaT (PSP1 superfamily)